MGQVEPDEGNFIQEAWSRYVLLRPGMDMDGLRNSTKLRTARSWSWSERTPGTARTIIISVATVTLLAIPALLTNPAVFSLLLESAALSREGVTPYEFWSDFVSKMVSRLLGGG